MIEPTPLAYTRFGKAMKRMLIFAVVMLAACSPSGTGPIRTDVRSLTTTPEIFSGKRVEVEGVLAMGFEAMIFEDPIVPGRTEIWFDYADFPAKEKEERGFGRLLAAFEKSPAKGEWKLERMVHVRVVGTFSHAKKRENGFGHLSGLRSQLIIERVLEAEACKEEPNSERSASPEREAGRGLNKPVD